MQRLEGVTAAWHTPEAHVGRFSGLKTMVTSCSNFPQNENDLAQVYKGTVVIDEGEAGRLDEASLTTTAPLFRLPHWKALLEDTPPSQPFKEHEADQYRRVRKSTASIRTLLSGSGDPFKTLPGFISGQIDFLAHHFNNIFILTTTPPGPRKRWFPFATTDPALFHGTLHIAASHIAALKRSRPSEAYYYHRGQVIQMVTARILNPDLAASDGTIGAVAFLLISDSMSGHPERVRAHMAGLQQLVSARGGFSKLNRFIQRLVGWVDLLASISLQEKPLFHPTQLVEPDLYSYYGPPNSSTISYALAISTRLVNFTGQQEPSYLASRILWGLRNLSILKETVNTAESDNIESISFSDRVELLERDVQRLLHYSLQDTSQTPDSDKLLIFTLFANAALIYIGDTLRDMVPSFMQRILTERLESRMDIDDFDLNILLGTFPELMLWILFIGGGAASGKSKTWFAKTASRILRVQKLEKAEDITIAATSFLWPEGRENYDDSAGGDIEMVNFTPVEIGLAVEHL